MALKKSIALGTVAVLSSLLGVLFFTQTRTNRELREENDLLRQELNLMAKTLSDDQNPQNPVAQPDLSQAATSDTPEELLRLRGQVTSLRRQVEELQQKTQPLLPTSQEQQPGSSQAGLVSLKAQLEEMEKNMDSARQHLQDLQQVLDVPDEIAILDPEKALNKPSLKKYEQYFKAREDYGQIERNRRVIYLKMVSEASESGLSGSSESSR